MSNESQNKIIVISRRLIYLLLMSLTLTALLFLVPIIIEKRFMVSWFSLECGIIGGFVSIQQRLKIMSDEDLTLLSKSWATIVVIPIFGGVFALVTYLLFLSGILKGHLFPNFYIPPCEGVPTSEYFYSFFMETYPSTGQDLAKLGFWSFVSGFSERFVPNIIKKVTSSQPGD